MPIVTRSHSRSPLGALGDLPLELRELVYSELLDTRAHEGLYRRDGRLNITQRGDKNQNTYHLHTNILYTSRSLYAEASAYLYDHNALARIRIPIVRQRALGTSFLEVPCPTQSPMLHCFGPFKGKHNFASRCRRHAMDIDVEHQAQKRKYQSIIVTASQLPQVVFWLSSVGLAGKSSSIVAPELRIKLHHEHHARDLISPWAELIYYQSVVFDIPLEVAGPEKAIVDAMRIRPTVEDPFELYERWIQMLFSQMEVFQHLPKTDYQASSPQLDMIYESMAVTFSMFLELVLRDTKWRFKPRPGRSPIAPGVYNDLKTLVLFCDIGLVTSRFEGSRADLKSLSAKTRRWTPDDKTKYHEIHDRCIQSWARNVRHCQDLVLAIEAGRFFTMSRRGEDERSPYHDAEKGLLDIHIPLLVVQNLALLAEASCELPFYDVAVDAYEKTLEFPHIKEDSIECDQLLQKIQCAKKADAAHRAKLDRLGLTLEVEA